MLNKHILTLFLQYRKLFQKYNSMRKDTILNKNGKNQTNGQLPIIMWEGEGPLILKKQ